MVVKRKRQNDESNFENTVRRDALKNKVTEKEMELNQHMRKLWGDNTFWMRNYIISYVNNSSDMKDVTYRLAKNQEEISRSIGLFYDEKAAEKVNKMLQQNLIYFGDILMHMLNKNKNGAIGAEKAWDEGTDKLVNYLGSLNKEWDLKSLGDHFKKYNEMTIGQAMSKVKRSHKEEIAAFDKAYNHAMYDLADFLTRGIVEQNPDKFDRNSKSYRNTTDKHLTEMTSSSNEPKQTEKSQNATNATNNTSNTGV